MGVYVVPCSSCHQQYIGETAAGIEKRITQHKNAIRCANGDNAIFVHQRDQAHRPDWTSALLIHRSTDVPTLRLVEAAIIKTTPNYNLKPGFDKIYDIMSQDVCNHIPDT